MIKGHGHLDEFGCKKWVRSAWRDKGRGILGFSVALWRDGVEDPEPRLFSAVQCFEGRQWAQAETQGSSVRHEDFWYSFTKELIKYQIRAPGAVGSPPSSDTQAQALSVFN